MHGCGGTWLDLPWGSWPRPDEQPSHQHAPVPTDHPYPQVIHPSANLTKEYLVLVDRAPTRTEVGAARAHGGGPAPLWRGQTWPC